MKGRKEKELIQKLGQMFEAPPPKGKEAFLRSQRPPKLHLGHLLAVQLTYLPKWVWLLFSGGFLAVLYAGRSLQMDMLWIAGALVPFLVLVSVTESFRSMSCGMEELEMAARFSLSGILLARMGILGLAGFAGLIVSAVVTFLRKRSLNLIACACGLSVLAYTVNNIFSFEQIMNVTTMFLLLGMGRAFLRKQEEPAGE